jgi:hypothetical protein
VPSFVVARFPEPDNVSFAANGVSQESGPSSAREKKLYQDGLNNLRLVLARALDKGVYALDPLGPSNFISQLSLPREPTINGSYSGRPFE